MANPGGKDRCRKTPPMDKPTRQGAKEGMPKKAKRTGRPSAGGAAIIGSLHGPKKDMNGDDGRAKKACPACLAKLLNGRHDKPNGPSFAPPIHRQAIQLVGDQRGREGCGNGPQTSVNHCT
jgi:hypothetical protein